MKKIFAMTLCLISFSSAFADQWQDLPVSIKNGIGVQVGQTAYVGLGSSNTALYKTHLSGKNLEWQKMADFIGPVTFDAAAAEANGDIFVFSGSGKASEQALSPIIFDDIYKYDTKENTWSKLDIHTPKGLLGAQAVSLGQGKIAIFGGYNKNKFDKYLYDIATTTAGTAKRDRVVESYMSMIPEDYDWNKQVLIFDANNYTWRVAGETPYLPNTGAAALWNGSFIEIINGEIKPGLRTDKVKQVYIDIDGITWKELAPIPAQKGRNIQEGLAGAFAGIHNNALIVAGGANFHGAKEASQAGNWFTHKGLTKSFNAEAYVRINDKWQQTQSIPHGAAYGSSFNTPNGVLFVGGENAQKEATSTVWLASWDGENLNIVD